MDIAMLTITGLTTAAVAALFFESVRRHAACLRFDEALRTNAELEGRRSR